MRAHTRRQGSPLIPSDLRMVAADVARCVVVVSDQSRSPAEADAQSVRWVAAIACSSGALRSLP
jgi:hypothetical protein